MKKKVKIFVGISLSIIVLASVAVMFSSKNDMNYNHLAKSYDYDSVKSYGNQQIWPGSSNTFAYDGNNLYAARWTEGKMAEDETWSKGVDEIVKSQIENPAVFDTVYSAPPSFLMLTQVSVFDGWIYFAECEDGDAGVEKYYLYRIREDGSDKEELGEFNGPSGNILYALTEEFIVYEDEQGISIMTLDGTKKELVCAKTAFSYKDLSGVDSGWIYYVKWGDILRRIRFDGTDDQKVLDLAEKRLYVVDGEQIFFSYYDDADETDSLVKKTIGGEEMILTTSSEFIKCVNKEGNWVYFGAGNKVYRINANGEEKELIYAFKNEKLEVYNIYVYGGDVLVTTVSDEVVYIKKDGTVTELTDYVGASK